MLLTLICSGFRALIDFIAYTRRRMFEIASEYTFLVIHFSILSLLLLLLFCVCGIAAIAIKCKKKKKKKKKKKTVTFASSSNEMSKFSVGFDFPEVKKVVDAVHQVNVE